MSCSDCRSDNFNMSEQNLHNPTWFDIIWFFTFDFLFLMSILLNFRFVFYWINKDTQAAPTGLTLELRQKRFKEVSKGCFKEVSSKFKCQGRFRGVSRKFKGVSGKIEVCFKEVPNGFQGSFNGVSWRFQSSLNGIS